MKKTVQHNKILKKNISSSTSSTGRTLELFSHPEQDSSLLELEHEISENISLFLKKHSVSGEKFPRELESLFKNSLIPKNPKSVSSQTRFILDKVVPQSINVSSSSFVGHMSTALPYFMLPLAKIMIALNQNLVKIETSKAFTPLERETIAKLHRLFYNFSSRFYDRYIQDRSSCLGVMCSGGTLSNLTALWAARNNLFSETEGFAGINREGLHRALVYYGYQDAVIITSQLGHYSLKKAADILGIGRSNLIGIETDSKFKMKLSVLEKTLDQLEKKRIAPIAVVAVAGTTETGTVDRLDEISSICTNYNVHMHVDAAWGGPCIFSRKHRDLLSGIERADSIGIDAHKQLYCPIGSGIVLFKNPTSASNIKFNANYIIRKNSRDLGKYSIEGSRSGMSLLVHSALNIIAKSGYETLIDRSIKLTKDFSSLVSKNEEFELINNPELNILTYRLIPKGVRIKLKHALESDNKERVFKINTYLNELTQYIQKTQREKKNSFVSRTSLKLLNYYNQDITVLRVVLSNPMTNLDILQSILSEQSSISTTFKKKLTDI